MNDLNPNVGVIESPKAAAVKVTVPVAVRRNVSGRLSAWLGQTIPMVVALGCAAGLAVIGQRTGWTMPKFSALLGRAESEKDTWCEAHSVPDEICVECRKELLPKGTEHGWCRIHGVHECPLCHPDVAQTSTQPVLGPEDRARADRALAFTPRVENNSKCKLHERRIQVVSDEVIEQLEIQVTPVTTGPVMEFVSAPGEIVFDPSRVARLSSRVPGTVWRVDKQVGDKVRRGDVLALVDAAEVGKAKAEFQQALVQLELRRQTLAGLRISNRSVAGKDVQEAESAVEESQVRLATAEQSLLNLGMSVNADEMRTLVPAEFVRRMQFLGLPATLATAMAGLTTSSNLIAVMAPLDGEVVERSAVAGQAADPTKAMFVVADTSRMWLTLRVSLEDANRIKPGQEVRFQHAGHSSGDSGRVTWISPSVEEKTRAVPVRVEMPNPAGRHHANTFGTAQVVLRVEPKATVVPSSAVHWEGDCNIVFVRDKNFDKADGPKVFHVRAVRPGAQEVAASGPVTEIIAGLLPGEWVATTNSGIFRTELLKNNLGAG